LRYGALVLIPFRKSGRENTSDGVDVYGVVVLIPFRKSGRENPCPTTSSSATCLNPLQEIGEREPRKTGGVTLLRSLNPLQEIGERELKTERTPAGFVVLIRFRKSGRENADARPHRAGPGS